MLRSKAITDLVGLSDDELFAELAAGLDRVAEDVLRLQCDAGHIAPISPSARILSTIAEEEAAKFLILIDAARCPRTRQRALAEHLPKFNQHLAKGIYAQASWWNTATFGELRGYVDRERPKR